MMTATSGILGGKINSIPTNISQLLIQKKPYAPSTTNFDFNTSLGGGVVSFTGHATYNSSSNWGPHQLFDNTRTNSDWCNLGGVSPLFGQFTFPRNVTIEKIFLVPRSQEDNFPLIVSLVIDSVAFGTFGQSSIYQSQGMQITYSGIGIYIQPMVSGRIWRLNFPGPNSYIGEIEFWGY